MSRTSKKSPIHLPSAEEDRAITAAAKADPDAQPLTGAQLSSMVRVGALRGRPPKENKKQLVSIRYSPEVLAYFQATGAGWQVRLDAVLKEYVAKRTRRSTSQA